MTAERAVNPAYSAEGLTQIINSILYANDPEELERANVRAAKRYASYTVPAMRAPENMEELLWDVAGTAYGNMMQNALFSLMGPTGAGTKAADAVLANTGNQRLAKAIGRSVDNTMAGLPINVLQGLAVDGEAEDKIKAITKGVLYDALSGYGSSRIEDIAGDAYARLSKNRASQSSSTDLAALDDDAYFRELQRYVDEGTADDPSVEATERYLPEEVETAQTMSKDDWQKIMRRFSVADWDVDKEPQRVYDTNGEWLSKEAKAKKHDVWATVTINATGQKSHDQYQANKVFYQNLGTNSLLKSESNKFFHCNVMAYMKSGKGMYINPSPDWVWHHPIDLPGEIDPSNFVMELVPEWQHKHSLYQDGFHKKEDRSGGGKALRNLLAEREKVKQ